MNIYYFLLVLLQADPYNIMQNNLSPRHQNIIYNLVKALKAYNVSLQDLIKKIFSFPKEFLTDKEFQKVIKFGDLKLTFQEIDGIFTVLEDRDRVSVDLLNSLLKRVSSQEDPTTLTSINSGNDLKLVGIKEVKNYLREKGPYEVFDIFDNDKDDRLDIKELNNLFVACSQTFKDNKEARVATIRLLLQKLPYNMIDIKRFLTTFGLENEPKRVVLDEPLDMMKSRLDINLKNMYITKQKVKPYTQTQPIKPIIPNNYPIMKKQQIKNQSLKKQQPQNNFFQPTPPPSKPNNYSHLTNSLQYYRLEEKYIQILQLVEFYLGNRETFVDSQNPKSSKGEFTNANKIFKGKFSLIEVAQSVIERQKHRKGLGLEFEAKDIIQGSVGNCYLLSSLSSVVDRYPEFVSNYFLFNVNPSGIYVVRLFNDGQWSNIVLDDRFPCNGIKPIYAKPHGNQLWVMLLEKAWAKLHGSYQNIDLGSSLQAFIALTGAPCKYIRQQEDKQNDTKSFILDGFNRKGMVTCSGSPRLNKMDKQESDRIGLIGSHAYSVLNFFSVTDPQTKQNVEIIKIRNPWGNLEWKGDWSFNSKKWSPELRQKYNYAKNPNDGSFYMDYHDFSVFFSSITVCYMEPNYVNSSMRINVDRHLPTYVSFKISKPGNYVFTIYQQSKRKYLHKGTYQLSESSLIITTSGNDYKYIKSGTKGQSNLYIEGNFEAGIYVSKLNVKWNYFNSHQCVLTSYGPESVHFKEIKGSQVEPKFTADMINTFANKFPGQSSNYTKIGIPEATRQVYFSIDYGLGFIKIKNPSKKQFTSSITLKEQKGLKLLDIFEMPMKANMFPNTEQLYGFTVSGKGYSYSLEEHLQYKG